MGQPSTGSDDLFLLLDRKGFREETHFKFAYSPIPDETVPVTGIGGVLVTVAEITEEVFGARQMKTLRELSVRVAEAQTPTQACEAAATILADNSWDVPFCLFYLLDPDGCTARLVAEGGFRGARGPGNPTVIDLRAQADDEAAWMLATAAKNRAVSVVSDVRQRFPNLPQGHWSEPPRAALVIPLASAHESQPYGFMIAGTNPHRELSDDYRTFFGLTGGQVVASIRNARALERERLRADALAELDRAKTMFFSNVSHEFRTPLTLMLGPLEDALSIESKDERLPPGQRQRLELVQRNSVRLLKLVNTLLDFSRIEAGRTQPMREPTDLAALTRELASAFESAMVGAGLRFVVAAPPLPQPVFVDRTMWEKIVLNLVSNALKFTLEGEVAVTLRSTDGEVVLEVRDTGGGIPATELPNLFTRFHRIAGVQARSHEGSGIGLALVKELANLHGGTVQVTSELGKGSTFTVRLPPGAYTTHAPKQPETDVVENIARRGAMPSVSEMFAQEASHWGSRAAMAPDASVASPSRPQPVGRDSSFATSRVLVVEDNPDMASYIKGILAPMWNVEIAPDGLAALDAIRKNPPDLVLSDVMMPRMDGLQLVQAIRANPVTAALPIILLSARASEEASVDGLEAGADDYLAKPFTTRSLVARVRVHLELGRMRRELAEQEEQLRQVHRLKEMDRFKTQFINTAAHELLTPIAPLRMVVRTMGMADHGGAQWKNLDLLERNLDRLQRIVQDLLDASRLDAAKLGLHKRMVDLSHMASETIDLFEKTAARAEVTVQARLEPNLMIEADPDRLAQILQNLISNAIKFTPASGIVTVRTQRDGRGGGQVQVHDTGNGIDSAFMPQMFTPFSRSHLKEDKIQPGTGLGLYITKGLVELHQGTIACQSDGPGKGTTFTVTFPL